MACVSVEPSKQAVNPEPKRGITCRDCGCAHFWTIYVRKQDKRIMRRRECRHCGKRITTSEKESGT